jgi:hypothetical protein
MLSPLFLEEDLSGPGVPLVSVMPGPMPSINQVQALNLAHTPTPSTDATEVPNPFNPTPATEATEMPPHSPAASIISVLSHTEPTAVNRRAENLRREAREAEKEWSELKAKYQTAISEGKTAEGFILKRKMYDAEEKAKELHKKAAKRYFACNLTFSSSIVLSADGSNPIQLSTT